jgi:hypothetical protein
MNIEFIFKLKLKRMTSSMPLVWMVCHYVSLLNEPQYIFLMLYYMYSMSTILYFAENTYSWFSWLVFFAALGRISPLGRVFSLSLLLQCLQLNGWKIKTKHINFLLVVHVLKIFANSENFTAYSTYSEIVYFHTAKCNFTATGSLFCCVLLVFPVFVKI